MEILNTEMLLTTTSRGQLLVSLNDEFCNKFVVLGIWLVIRHRVTCLVRSTFWTVFFVWYPIFLREWGHRAASEIPSLRKFAHMFVVFGAEPTYPYSDFFSLEHRKGECFSTQRRLGANLRIFATMKIKPIARFTKFITNKRVHGV